MRVLVVTLLVMSLGFGSLAEARPESYNHELAIRQHQPVVLDLATDGRSLTLDPALATDDPSLTAIENLFLGLTDLNPYTGEIRPELAIAWDVSADGLTWTFTLRDDVQWYDFDPDTGTVAALRPVVADDVVYGIKRACDPRLSESAQVAVRAIDGCMAVNQMLQLDVNDTVVFSNLIGASAPDDRTVVIRLAEPVQYFLSQTPLLRAVPVETIETYGATWTAPGHLVNNGHFFVEQLGYELKVFVRNRALPLGLQVGGNVDKVVFHRVPDAGTQLALYNENQLDLVTIDPLYVQQVLDNPLYSSEVVRVFDLDVYYLGFANHRRPFDDVHVRRAFSAIIDRQAFVDGLRMGRGIPMTHFTPPNVPTGPDWVTLGVGFDPDYARDQLAAAGYPNCEGFPPIRITTYAGAEEWGAFLIAAAEEHLHCDSSLFTLETVSAPLFGVALWRSNVWTAGWPPYYADPYNWLGEVLSCDTESPLQRPCSEADTLLTQATLAPNSAARASFYEQAESAFFGEEGDYPIAPLFVEAGTFLLVKPWVSGPFETDGRFGGSHWAAIRVDANTKLANRP